MMDVSDSKPFHRSSIGAKCGCGVPQTVVKEHAFRRYLLPAGTYGDYWQPAAYYMAEWWTLECDQCKQRRDDVMIWKWHKGGDMTPIDPPFFDETKKRRYPDIKAAVLAVMEE